MNPFLQAPNSLLQRTEALEPGSLEEFIMQLNQSLNNPMQKHEVWPELDKLVPDPFGQNQNDNGIWPPVQKIAAKDQGRMGLDTSGLAAMINASRENIWPQGAGEVSEQPGMLQGPNSKYFVDPTFVGPMPPAQLWNIPTPAQMGTRNRQQLEGAFPAVLSDSDYERLVNQMWSTATLR